MGEKLPKYPIPKPPGKLWFVDGSTMLRWQGAAWAKSYKLSIVERGSGQALWLLEVSDGSKEGFTGVELTSELENGRGDRVLRLRSVGVDGEMSDYSQELHF